LPAPIVFFQRYAGDSRHVQLVGVPFTGIVCRGLQTHAMLMPLGFFPLFILGFTFTAGPKWLAMPDEKRGFVLAGASYLTGVAGQVVADISGLSWAGLAGSVLMLLAWLGVTLRWAGICGSSAVKDRWHGWVLLSGMMHGAVALFTMMLVRAGLPQYTLLTTALAVFGFLLPVFLNVCHRAAILQPECGAALSDVEALLATRNMGGLLRADCHW
jgi:hypothetical protein